MVPRIEPAGWAAMAAALRARVEPRLVEVGEKLGGSPLPSHDANDQDMGDYLLALDAYAAAGKVFDDADGLLDLAGVFVLLDIAAARFRAAAVRRAGHRPQHASKRCFLNPLHGAAAHEHEHHGKGARNGKRRDPRQAAAARPRVPVCAECLRRLKANQMPDALVVPITMTARRKSITGVPVPYYLLAPERSLWVATGFGSARGSSEADLVARVLRGEYRVARTDEMDR
ncbi:MAG TPA: hypothetical protein VFU73_06020 [Actinocrinis sp.]|nr:hypothetical protein [Actinocrinis sp.]